MPVTENDMILVKPANVPTNDSDPTGGAKTTTQITGSVIGELIPSQTANPFGSGDKTWYYKFFLKNNAGSGTFASGKVWIPNLLSDLAVNGTFSLISSSALDNTNFKAKIYGLDAGGANISEEIVLNGVTPVVGGTTFSELHCIEILNLSGVLTPLNGILTVTRSTVLGTIPAGCDYGLCEDELTIGKDATKNASTSAANRLTDPGVAYSTARTEATGLTLDDLTPGDGQGIWLKLIAPEGRARQSQARIKVRRSGDV